MVHSLRSFRLNSFIIVIYVTYNVYSIYPGLGCCPFWGGGSVVVGFLFVAAPVVGVCGCSVFCCALLYVHSSIAIILMGKRESWFLCLVCLPGVS